MKKAFTIWSACALLIVAAACTKNANPTRPSDAASVETESSVTDAASGITLTTPRAVAPAASAEIAFAQQPITLTVRNAAATGSTPTYTFQVATDDGFTSIVATKDNVAQGDDGQTSAAIDRLAGGKTYFWRARATSSKVPGPFSTARSFTVGPEVVLQTPVPLAPGNNATASGAAVLTVKNVDRSGPAGAISYKFDVSDSSSFSNIVFSETVPEQSGGQTSTSASRLTTNTTYYWRVQATDETNHITTQFSSPSAFRYIAFDVQAATFWDNPSDFKSWAETAHITSVQFTPNAFLVDFDRRTGPNRWPDVGFGTGNLQYTLGMCVNIRGAWHCSATVQFWYGREFEASGRPDEIGINWWYDGRWGALLGYQPQIGELVGIYVAAGNLRDSGNVILKERSDIVLMPFGGSYRR